MAEIIEWYQCRTCGRRQRWRAELAGTETACACGRTVVCPELRDFALEGTPEGAVSGDSTMSGSQAVAAAPRASSVDVPLETTPEARPILRRAPRRSWRHNVNVRAAVWTALALFGLALAIFAVIMAEWPWLLAAGVITPFTFWRWWRCERIWQGPRSLRRAVEETLGARE